MHHTHQPQFTFPAMLPIMQVLILHCFYSFCRILIVHEIKVHIFQEDNVGAPTLIEDVSSSTKRPLEPPNTHSKITPIAALHASLKEWTLKVRVLNRYEKHILRYDKKY